MCFKTVNIVKSKVYQLLKKILMNIKTKYVPEYTEQVQSEKPEDFRSIAYC